jgi:hypothetical protein
MCRNTSEQMVLRSLDGLATPAPFASAPNIYSEETPMNRRGVVPAAWHAYVDATRDAEGSMPLSGIAAADEINRFS